MSIDAVAARKCLKSFDFNTLFREHLGWDNHQAKLDIPVDGETVSLTAIAQKRGFVAFICPSIPDRPTRLKIDHQVTRSAREHFVIYTDETAGQQVWQWVRRETGKPIASRDHRFDVSQSGDPLIQRLDQIAVGIEEEEGLTLPDIAGRIRSALDVDKVTKKFYDRFKTEHTAFLKLIKGFPPGRKVKGKQEPHPDLQWYTSLMLNRVMFVYFIQKKGFLDGDTDYLRNRLAMIREARGKDKFQSFYRYFLLRLFHEGLGKHKDERKLDPAMEKLLGKVPYLNGGFFEVHQLEEHNPDIDIPDRAFEKLFDFFDNYRWHLDERPLRADNEINPDVVGYIFEKYINQKQMGAYYTKEDITEYISKNTILPYLFDVARKKCAVAFKPDSAMWRLLRDDPDRYIYPAVRQGVIDEKGKVVSLPKDIAAGIKDVSRRDGWNRSAEDPYALPTETWREHVARRQRCLDIRKKLSKGEVHEINDLITLNLDIWQFARDAIVNAEGPELLRAFWHTIAGRLPEKSSDKIEPGITILDPTCGSGAFLFAALRILETLYSDCLERMERFLEDSGTGVPPVKNHGQDAHATLQIRQGAYLPHWTREGATYAVTFRLADSLPRNVLEAWLRERDDIVATACQMNRPLSRSEEDRLRELHSERVEAYLDAGHGKCWMKEARVAKVVADALKHFDGDRYELVAWAIMPNHVHAVLRPREGRDLPSILHSWKSFTAKEANRVLGRTGQFWQEEYYDHLIRDQQDFAHAVRYTLENPEKSGLKNWKWVGGTGVPPVKDHGQDAHATATRKYRDFRRALAQIGEHRGERYFILKSIIINNLFGVDIMEEAVEICKLRLFLKLVAQVDTFDQIEPLPDIDFNIRAGNTLVGFASLDQVKQSMEGDMLKLLELPRIEESAEEVDRLFQQFRAQQMKHGGKVTPEDKQELRGRLAKLDAELDRYLASEYGVDFEKQKDFDAWKTSHEPFHWFVEFYGIMHGGGFDVIIGNPPWKEYSAVKKTYKVRGYTTERGGNLYGLCSERSATMLSPHGFLSFIVQLPIVSSSRMCSMRDFLIENGAFLTTMTCDDRPGKLFDGLQHCRSTIFLLQRRSNSEQARLWSSGYRRWATDVRKNLFTSTTYSETPDDQVRQSQFPKLASFLQVSAYEKVFRRSNPQLALTTSAHPSKSFVFYQESAQYWVKATVGLPHYSKNGEVGAPAHGRYLYFKDIRTTRIACAIFNSSLFYTYFIAYSDCFHVSDALATGIPVPPAVFEDDKLAGLGMKLMRDLQHNAEKKTINTKDGNRIAYDEFRVGASKSIIDEIDHALAKHYSFTDEELDFIINYDIKYRMGGALEGGE